MAVHRHAGWLPVSCSACKCQGCRKKNTEIFLKRFVLAIVSGYIGYSEVGTEGPGGVPLSFREGLVNSVQRSGGGLFNLRAATTGCSTHFSEPTGECLMRKTRFAQIGVLGCLVMTVLALPASAAKIGWVSFHGADNTPTAAAATAGFTAAPDKGYTDLLTSAGHQVTRFVSQDLPTPADLATFNAFDVDHHWPVRC